MTREEYSRPPKLVPFLGEICWRLRRGEYIVKQDDERISFIFTTSRRIFELLFRICSSDKGINLQVYPINYYGAGQTDVDPETTTDLLWTLKMGYSLMPEDIAKKVEEKILDGWSKDVESLEKAEKQLTNKPKEV